MSLLHLHDFHLNKIYFPFTNYSTSSEVPQNHIDLPSTYSQALSPLIHKKLRLFLSAASVALWSKHCTGIAKLRHSVNLSVILQYFFRQTKLPVLFTVNSSDFLTAHDVVKRIKIFTFYGRLHMSLSSDGNQCK